MKPEQVLDMQADLLDRLEHSDRFVSAVGFAIASDAGVMDDTREARRFGRGILRDHVAKHVRLADAYRVTEEMSVLVEYAASRLDDDDRFQIDMAPTPWGIVRFDRGIPFQDVRGKKMLAHWMTWGPVSQSVTSPLGEQKVLPSVLVTWWSDPLTEEDEVYRETPRDLLAKFRKVLGRWAWVGSNLITNQQPLGPSLSTLEDGKIREWLETEGTIPDQFTNASRIVYALWALMGQTITDVSEERIPRAAQKRVGRMRTPGRVSVITLRRKSGRKSEGETLVEWRHRWMVRGYWRDQHYADGTTRRIYVHPYMKLADRTDLPLVQTTKVYNLTR